MIPETRITKMQYARAVQYAKSPEVVADALALYTASRLREQILQALAKSPIDAGDARELADLILRGGEGR